MGLRKMYAPRSTFSEEDDRILISLQEEHGNKWTYIVDVMNEMTDTEWSMSQVRSRFRQLEIDKKQGGRKKRRVNFSEADDAQLVAFRDEWLKTHTCTYGMWQAMQTKMPGKTIPDLVNRWLRKLSKLSAVSSSADSSSAADPHAIDGETETMLELPPPRSLRLLSICPKLFETDVVSTELS